MDDDVTKHATPYATERQGLVFDFLGAVARFKQRHGADATTEHLALAHMAYVNGNPLGLREAVTLCREKRPLPAWASAALVRLLDTLIAEVSPGRGHSTMKNRLDELQTKLACWAAVRTARRSKLRFVTAALRAILEEINPGRVIDEARRCEVEIVRKGNAEAVA